MEIIHNYFIRIPGEDEKRKFLEAGIQLQKGVQFPDGSTMTSFDLAENDPGWPRAAGLAARFKAIETIATKFTEAECDSAKYLGIVATSHRGYPEPSRGKGYLSATFDLSNFCPLCGVGRRQAHPFRIKTAPTLHNSMMQLNWVFDEFFVAPGNWARLFNPMGIGCRPVLKDSSGAELDSIVQLDISQCVDLKSGVSDGVKCPRCARRKSPISLSGYFPEPVDTDAPMFKSSQYFGNAISALRLVFVSNALYQKIKNASLKGVSFYPCRG